MIQAPTNIGTYTECYAADEALLQDANLLRVARETGDWLPLIVDGKTPTRFTMRVIPGHVFRKIVDLEVGSSQRQALLFRAACVGISGIEPFKFSLVKDQEHGLGQLASLEVVDFLDAVDLNIVNELALAVMNRVFLRPKS